MRPRYSLGTLYVFFGSCRHSQGCVGIPARNVIVITRGNYVIEKLVITGGSNPVFFQYAIAVLVKISDQINVVPAAHVLRAALISGGTSVFIFPIWENAVYDAV